MITDIVKPEYTAKLLNWVATISEEHKKVRQRLVTFRASE
jgi:hypothetical protein